jgi:ribosomal protein L16/L10AE
MLVGMSFLLTKPNRIRSNEDVARPATHVEKIEGEKESHASATLTVQEHVHIFKGDVGLFRFALNRFLKEREVFWVDIISPND